MPTLSYTPPAVNTQNVVWGTGLVYTNTVGSSLPTDANLGVGSAWTTLGWNYPGATDGGVSMTWNPSTVNIDIEEQPTPVAVLVDKATFTITMSFAEETMANMNLALGQAGTIAVTAAGAGQPGKSVLSLSTANAQIACAVVGKNQNGYARVFYVPAMMSTGDVKVDFRRSANERMWPVTFNSVCPTSSIEIIDLTAPATS
jgi:hypothetical protein